MVKIPKIWALAMPLKEHKCLQTPIHFNALYTTTLLAILDGAIIWQMDLNQLTTNEIALVAAPVVAISYVARTFASNKHRPPRDLDDEE